MALLKVLPIFGIALLILSIVFMIRGDTALGAAFIALGTSQIAVFAALSAQAKKDAVEETEG